jgi:nicotinamide-nucleotide amidase
MTTTAEIIAIGDELTSGERLDTNSQWLSQRLAELGVRTLFHTTVGDDLASNVRAFREARDRVDWIIVTGGLGPTADDLTREALAAAMNAPLVENEMALHQIRSLFARRGREMPERNALQAMFPAGSRVVPNPHGTAPGIDFESARPGRSPARFICLPGVPAEMKEMWRESVAPTIRAALPGPPRLIRHRCVKCFGVGESHIEQMLPDLIRRGRQPSVGITVHRATITLRVTAEGVSDDECEHLIQPTIDTISTCLGDLVYGRDEEELQDVVARCLSDQQTTLAVAEWGTGGLITEWMSEVTPPNPQFLGGLVIRNREALQRCLDVPRTLIEQCGENSREVVRDMAERCRQMFRADMAIAVGPFPEIQSSAASPQHVHYALATPDEIIAESAPYAGHPDILQALIAKRALNAARLYLVHRR